MACREIDCETFDIVSNRRFDLDVSFTFELEPVADLEIAELHVRFSFLVLSPTVALNYNDLSNLSTYLRLKFI